MDLRFYFLAMSVKMSEAMRILVKANVATTEMTVAKVSLALARHHSLLRSLAVVVLGYCRQ
jgi:hypothetical protein